MCSLCASIHSTLSNNNNDNNFNLFFKLKARAFNPDAKMAAICLHTQIVIKRLFSPRLRLLTRERNKIPRISDKCECDDHLLPLHAVQLCDGWCIVFFRRSSHSDTFEKLPWDESNAAYHSISVHCFEQESEPNFPPGSRSKMLEPNVKPHCV